MTDERPETLLKSALEKIVYFEARSTQLANDADQQRSEVLRMKNELAAAAQREIELRRVIAELEVRATRAHAEREEAARLTEHLRRERADLIGKILEASRIHQAGQTVEVDHHDLARFIAELRAEVLDGRAERDAERARLVSELTGGKPGSVERRLGFALASSQQLTAAQGPATEATDASVAAAAEPHRVASEVAPVAPHAGTSEATVTSAEATEVPAARAEDSAAASTAGNLRPDASTLSRSASPALLNAVRDVATSLRAEGRLGVTAKDLATLENAAPFAGRTEETLFGFSVRELSAIDAAARVRAADRLKALAQPAAAPALATALHAETEPTVQVALLGALATFANAAAVPVVQPLLASPAPDVRIAALKALLALDPGQAAPHLAAATKDPEKAVRRRASLLALGLEGPGALELGANAIRDVDADVRALAALVLGASGVEAARPLLIEAMRDRDARVVRSAAQALSRLLGTDVTPLGQLDEAQRRREVRRLSTLPANPIRGTATALERLQAKLRAPGAPRAELQDLVAPARANAVAARASAPVVAAPASSPVHAAHTTEVRIDRPRVTFATRAAEALAAAPVTFPHPPAAEVVAAPRASVAPAAARSSVVAAPVAHGAALASAHAVVSAVAAPVAHGATPMSGHPAAAPHPGASASVAVAVLGAHAATPVSAHVAAAHAVAPAAVAHATVGTRAVTEPAAPVIPSVTRAVAAMTVAAAPARTAVAVLDEPVVASPEIGEGVLRELRASIRGRPLEELAAGVGAGLDVTRSALGALLAAGQIVRRGHKYFVA